MPAKPAQPPPPPTHPPVPNNGAGDGDMADAQELALVRAIQRDGPANSAAWTTLLRQYQDRLYAVCLRMVGNADTAADLTQDTMVKIIQGLPGYDARSKLSTWMIRVAMNTCFSYLRGQKLRKHASLDEILDSGAITDRPASSPSTSSAPATPTSQPPPPGHKAPLPIISRNASTSSPKNSESVENEPTGAASKIPITNHTQLRTSTEHVAFNLESSPDIQETNPSPKLFTGPGGAGAGPGGWREQSREQSPQQSVELWERGRTVASALASLAPDQRAILVLRDVQGLDYDQIGQALELAVGTVKSRLFRARVALREAIEKLEATDYTKD
ncbi:MAG: RNA polymerase sigma factor [Pyrinomonadaceae bacterium]|nr:RNA polymerase sigma factor [Phycisphaerales bacterium]